MDLLQKKNSKAAAKSRSNTGFVYLGLLPAMFRAFLVLKKESVVCFALDFLLPKSAWWVFDSQSRVRNH